MTAIDTERKILQLLRPALEAEGYSVLDFPSSELLPDFFAGYRPDAVALGAGKNIAIEIKVRKDPSSESLRSLSERFQGHPEWELRIVYGDEVEEPAVVASASKEDLERHLAEVQALLRGQHLRAALVLGWALIEAIARREEQDLPRAGNRTTKQAIEILEGSGKLTFEDAQTLRRLLPLRSRIVHGDFGSDIQVADVEPIVNAARSALAV